MSEQKKLDRPDREKIAGKHWLTIRAISPFTWEVEFKNANERDRKECYE